MMNSASAQDVAYHLHPYTNPRTHEEQGPFIVTRGEGIRIWDGAGKEYIEAVAGLWCVSLGFGEPRLIDAAARQLKKLSYYQSFSHSSNEVTAELAERLIDLFPTKMSKVLFSNSGSEANDTAVKVVWYYNNARQKPRKKKIISHLKGYHGVTVATASLTGLPRNHRDFDLPLPFVRHAQYPHYYRLGEHDESEEEFVNRLVAELEGMLISEDPDTVAAFIAEPVMGAGGVIVPPANYFRRVQEVLRKYDVLMIADEIVTGFARTGAMFGSETFGIEPDIVTLAKQLSSGYAPIGATLISEEIYQCVRARADENGLFAHGYTYSGHPLCAAIALETLKIYEERRILDHVKEVMPFLETGVRRFANHPLVGDIRTCGLIAGIELVQDKHSRQPFAAAGKAGATVAAFARKHGLIVRAIDDTVALSPPLIITEADIEEILLRLGRALDETLTHIGR